MVRGDRAFATHGDPRPRCEALLRPDGRSEAGRNNSRDYRTPLPLPIPRIGTKVAILVFAG